MDSIGLLAEELDVVGLLEHLRLLVGNPGLWEAIPGAGRRDIEAEYQVVKQADRLKDSYMTLYCRRGIGYRDIVNYT